MLTGYKILWEGGSGELIVKKSRFIATTKPVCSEEEAAGFVESLRKKYWDASHNCYAYVIGERGQLQKCSDDGEPAQTAGRPMLDVILGEGVRDICVVVTRYFGGTLLGTGGLTRAYSGAVREGLKNSRIIEKRPGSRVHITAEYSDVGRIQYIQAKRKLAALNTQYTDHAEFVLMAPQEEAEALRAELTEATGGRSRIETGEPEYYGVVDGEVVLF